jgi:gentisate 1,2-dioxygenase
MKLYRFDIAVGENIDQYESTGFVISKIARLFEEAVVNCAYLSPNSVIGYHQTTDHQLFLVVQGKGWVRDEKSERTPIKAGQAAYWMKNEWHESGTETGLIVILIDGAKFDLSKLTPLH